MGGNVSATPEFNIWVDPEAARTVFSAGLREIAVVPLDATHSAPPTLADCDAFDAQETPAGSAAAAFLRHRIRQDQTPDRHKSEPSAPVHDPLRIAYLVRPDVITSSGRFLVSVETAGEQTLGQVIIDTRPWAAGPANAMVAFAASSEVFREVLLEAFAVRFVDGRSHLR